MGLEPPIRVNQAVNPPFGHRSSPESGLTLGSVPWGTPSQGRRPAEQELRGTIRTHLAQFHLNEWTPILYFTYLARVLKEN